MKKLRNIAIYYIILGIVLGGFLWAYFFPFWRFSVLGLALLLIYLVLRYLFRVKSFPVRWSEGKMRVWNMVLWLHPLLLAVSITWYATKPFSQSIVLPRNYEGLVVIDYGQPEGQEKNWTGTFLGMGGRRLIRVDETGHARTQFKYDHVRIPLLDIDERTFNVSEDIELYYENDLDEVIPQYQGITELYTDTIHEIHKNNRLPVAYSTRLSEVRNIFVVCKPTDYYRYFYTEEEVQELYGNGDEGYYRNWQNLLRHPYSEFKNSCKCTR